MTILGINIGHDASAAIVKSGKILGALEEEKLSRIKKDFGYPRLVIDYLLNNNQIKKSEIDVIAIGGINRVSDLGKKELLFRFSKNKKDKYKEYWDRIIYYLFENKNYKNEHSRKAVIADLLKKEGFVNARVEYVDHHLAHAATAYYCAPFKSDLVFTSDGFGDSTSSAFYVPKEDDSLECVMNNEPFASVGAFYSSITQLLGFKPNRHEGKITGLAAYGKETSLNELFYNLFSLEGNELKRFPDNKLDHYYKEYNLASTLSLSDRINLKAASQTGGNYSKAYFVLLEHIRRLTEGFSKEDIAYACQKTAEQVSLDLLDHILKTKAFPEKINLTLAGGVFANVRINQLLYEHPRVDNIFVQPAMGDSGLALGCAILADREDKGEKHYVFEHTYWGADFSDEVESFTKTIDTALFNVRKMEEPAKEVAEQLKNNVIIGFWHGAMEWGPRALGSRTIMLNTFDKTVNQTLNDRLNRTEFMPFAPVVLDYCAKTYFPKYSEDVPAGNYMTITYDTDEAYHELLQATVHVDGTARPQVIDSETNKYYYDVLDEFYKLTNCGALVNTSFNAHEEPIVSTPAVAFKALKDGRIDALVLDEYLIFPKK